MRTRFAPSPTGFLHIGGLRTALFSYLVAKKANGTFILRIEDTDEARGVPGAVENILQSLSWAGIEPDEGVILRNGNLTEEGSKGPYVQSKRLKIYGEYAERLLTSGHAYRCFCTKECLEEMRKIQAVKRQAPMYDGRCREISKAESDERLAAGKSHVIRLKVPRSGKVEFTDCIRGRVEFPNHTIDDQVLLKSDGPPTYHLAHVVDDHMMEIDLVIRGEEWLPSLPKHLLLFEALGWTPPAYAHVPLIMSPKGGKLSKRDADVAVEDYRKKGYLPEALVNFIALLGWNPGTTRHARSGTAQAPEKEQEIFSMEDLIEKFSIDRVQKSGAVFNLEKLNWMQGQWMRKIPAEEFASRIQPFVEEKYDAAGKGKGFANKAKLIQERITFFSEAPGMLSFFYEEPKVSLDLLANEKQRVRKEDLQKIFKLLQEALDSIPAKQWAEENLKEVLFDLAEKQKLKRGQLLWPLRAALTGLPYSPGAFEVAAALGKEETMKRLCSAS
jgi:nondiscriminating glutamyl-tRNA synthetase